MQYGFPVCALLVAAALFARPGSEPPPQLTWQGEVDGTALLYVRGKHLKTEYKDGAPIARQRSRMNDPLPDSRQEVRLQVLEGRGYVCIVEQPRADNGFTLTLAIEDRQPGPGFYSLALYWANDNAERRRVDQIRWSGRIDEEAVVSCTPAGCTSSAAGGAPVMHEKVKLSRPLPQSEVAVDIQTTEGRGEVRIIEQPSERNGYTTRVRIRDRAPGASDYAFTLSWRHPDASFSSEAAVPRRGLLWSGRVTGTVRVSVMGGAAFSQTASGQPVSFERTLFDRPLPAGLDIKPVITKRQGRGAVEIVEYPTSRNGYQLVFEIRTADIAPELCEVEVAW